MTSRVLVSVLASLAIAALASVQPAAAARRVVTVSTSGSVQGQPLRLVGDQVVFSTHSSFKPFLIEALPANGAPRQLTQVTSAPPSGADTADISTLALAASPSALAYSVSRGVMFRAIPGTTLSAEVFDGPFAGPFGRLDSCTNPVSAFTGYPVAASGSLVAHTTQPCHTGDSGGATLIVDDLASGAATPRRTITLPAPADHVAVAGNFAAAMFALPSGREQISVFDLGTTAESYHAVDSAGQAFTTFDLQADGKVLALLSAGPTVSCDKLAWFSPADPSAHLLPETCAVGGEVRLVGGRAVYFSAARGPSELMTSTLDGSALQILMRVTLTRPGTHVVVPFDYDGTHAAWALRSCPGRTTVFVDDLMDSSPMTFGSCGPVTIPRQTPRLSRGRLPVRLRCPGGCSGAILLSTGGRANIVAKGFATGSSSTVVKLRVPNSFARELRRRGHPRVRIDVSLTELDGLTAQQTRGRTLTVSK
jgi:hypothetical protein